MDAESSDSMDDLYAGEYANIDLNRWIVSAGYDYPLSKRTDVYGVVPYNQDSDAYNTKGEADEDPTVFGVMIGLRHKF